MSRHDRYVPPAAASLARLILQWGVAFALGRGWIRPGEADGFLLLGSALIAGVWGVRVTYKRTKKLDRIEGEQP